MEYSWKEWQSREGVVYLVQPAEYETIGLEVETDSPSGVVCAAFVVGRGGKEVPDQSPPLADDTPLSLTMVS